MEILLDAQAISTGLGFVLEEGTRPTLCMIAHNMLRLAVAHELGIVLSWEQALELDAEASEVFIIPVRVAKMLTSGILEDVDTLHLRMTGQRVRLTLNNDTPVELRWQWTTPSALGGEADLESMLIEPQKPVEVERKELVTLIQQALKQPETLNLDPNGFVPISKVPRTVNVGGHNLGLALHPIYFDPRALARALELIGDGERILVQVNDAVEHPFLAMVSKRDGWHTQCAVKAATGEPVVAAAGEPIQVVEEKPAPPPEPEPEPPLSPLLEPEPEPAEPPPLFPDIDDLFAEQEEEPAAPPPLFPDTGDLFAEQEEEPAAPPRRTSVTRTLDTSPPKPEPEPAPEPEPEPEPPGTQAPPGVKKDEGGTRALDTMRMGLLGRLEQEDTDED